MQVSSFYFSLVNHSTRTVSAPDSSKVYSVSVTEALLTQYRKQTVCQVPIARDVSTVLTVAVYTSVFVPAHTRLTVIGLIDFYLTVFQAKEILRPHMEYVAAPPAS